MAGSAGYSGWTLDGQNTFRVSGMIAAPTPGTKRQMPVSGCYTTAAVVDDVGKIDVPSYKGSCDGSLSLLYRTLQILHNDDPTRTLELPWEVIWPSVRQGLFGLV